MIRPGLGYMARILGDIVPVAFYTAQPFSRLNFFRASGEAILGTLKYILKATPLPPAPRVFSARRSTGLGAWRLPNLCFPQGLVSFQSLHCHSFSAG